MKKFITLLFLPLCAQAFPAQYSDINACIEAGKTAFAAQKPDDARKIFTDCGAIDPKNTDALISLAGIYLAQNNMQAAKTLFEKAASILPKSSPYNAYVYSRLGDIYFKRGDFKSAKYAYETALKFNNADVNALIGFGVTSEYAGDAKTASDYYKTALSVEPYNTVARENLRRLEPKIFTDAEILAALKLRGAVPDTAAVLPPDGRALFLKIHRAEQSQGVEFLNEKYKDRPPKGLIIEAGTNTPELRFMLSLAGYKEVMRLMSLDAASYFASAGVKTYDVYNLRDADGRAVFGPDKTLTEAGIPVYTQALAGKKTFILPNEEIPAAAKEQNARIKNLLASGNAEISAKEYQYIKDKTLCSEETLIKRAGVKIIIAGNVIRRFVIDPSAQTPQIASPDPRFFPYYYAMTLRSKNAPNSNAAPAYENFFGTGRAGDITLCDKKTGTIKSAV